ncbi:hypothetical protein Tdes44962_MAKER08857 [Teratosphaeria destructans]|uniref:Uncharacterized protein n=1 Tax=Teratosphaeria destructans TaxID=418781 RepID=A0A9W7SV09_9PEZI|nr:hypothetical protein Tdes44962_MAKER08857 [Teratosphaeria destructans]
MTIQTDIPDPQKHQTSRCGEGAGGAPGHWHDRPAGGEPVSSRRAELSVPFHEGASLGARLADIRGDPGHVGEGPRAMGLPTRPWNKSRVGIVGSGNVEGAVDDEVRIPAVVPVIVESAMPIFGLASDKGFIACGA